MSQKEMNDQEIQEYLQYLAGRFHRAEEGEITRVAIDGAVLVLTVEVVACLAGAMGPEHRASGVLGFLVAELTRSGAFSADDLAPLLAYYGMDLRMDEDPSQAELTRVEATVAMPLDEDAN